MRSSKLSRRYSSTLIARVFIAAPALAAALSCSLVSTRASATNVLEFPDNGSEQMGRGGAWIARASDPLATYFNPAGLAGQETAITLQANVSLSHRCMTRVKAANDTTNDPLIDPNVNLAYPKVCADISPFPNPQLGFTWRLSDRVGIGFLPLFGPSAVGKANWPEFIDGRSPNQAAPQRYLLIDANLLLLTPTIGAGFEPIDGLRLGASFQWGIAGKVHFSNASMANNADGLLPKDNDVRAQIDAKQLFIPGFTLGGIWSASDNIDLAGWYKWSAPVDAKGDVTTYFPYFTPAVANGNTSGVKVGDTSQPNCGISGSKETPCAAGDIGNVKVPIPMEAKIGVRYHQPRAGATLRKHHRDPLSQDLFDIELNLTWANNSVFENVQLRFPGNADGQGIIPVNGTPGTLPPTADVPHKYKDVMGVRLGGDYNVIGDKLAIRAGAFFETRAQDPQYQNIDIAGAERYGVALGGTYRIRMGAEKKSAIELHAGYGHIFFATQSNTNPTSDGVHGLAGTQCNGGTPAPNGVCSTGQQQYRTNWPINLGTITNAVNVINVGATYRF